MFEDVRKFSQLRQEMLYTLIDPATAAADATAAAQHAAGAKVSELHVRPRDCCNAGWCPRVRHGAGVLMQMQLLPMLQDEEMPEGLTMCTHIWKEDRSKACPYQYSIAIY